MKRYTWLVLGLLPLLAGCPKRGQVVEEPRDYDGVRDRADKAFQSHDNDPVNR
jgi:hypothetical protein